MMKDLNTHNIGFMPRKQYSTTTRLQSDKETPLKHSFSNKLKELKDEKEALKDDLNNVTEAINVASKISTGETTTEEENECLSELQENYPAFFDSEGEQEGSSSLLNKIMGVKNYLRKELRANKKSYYKISKQIDQEQAADKPDLSTNIHDTIKASSSKRKVDAANDSEESSSSKRKIDAASDSEESSSSKKSCLSPSDYVDSLPYNPFDDIGTD